MRMTPPVIAVAAFVTAACLAWLGALWAVAAIESRSTAAVTRALSLEGVTWAAARADGLQLELSGTAPTESERFHALTVAGTQVDAARLIDAMQVAPSVAIAPPRYSMEILRNSDGISLIGLIPAAAAGREAMLASIARLAGGAKVTDMLNTADYTVPPNWDSAVAYGIAALDLLPRSKISILSDRVTITAIADSAAEKRRMETALVKSQPEGLAVAMAISAPRPVITPFTLRFLIEPDAARFDACSADTAVARDIILAAATKAGLQGKADCVLGLGVPSPNWARAVATGIAGLAELGAGSLTFSDADISLIAGPSVDQASFDRVVGDLNARLPEVFSLKAVMPEQAAADAASAGPVEFTASLSVDGFVQLRGRLPDERVRDAVDSYARARFGSDQVYTATRLDGGLPGGWPLRVLSALEALAELDHGSVLVQPEALEIKGVTGNPGASANIARILSEKLGSGRDFRIAVAYDKALDPDAGLPTPRECATNIEKLLVQQKIGFEPGNAEIDPATRSTITAIARVLTRCGAIPFEIGAHSDAQGRDAMNLSLSQARAEAVVQALAGLGAGVAGLSAKGYGETQPIADNKSEAGREANRRIVFRLLLPEAEAGDVAQATVAADAVAPAAGTADAAAQSPVTDAAPADSSGANPNAAAAGTDPAVPGVVVLPAAPDQARPKPRPPAPKAEN